MLEQRIQQHFIDSADLHYQVAPMLCKPIESAVYALVNCITSGGKVLVCGNGTSAADALHFAGHMMSPFERERPGFACIALTESLPVLSAIAHSQSYNHIFSQQINALGLPGDVLVVLSADGNAANILAAVQSAFDREMTVIALMGEKNNELSTLLRDVDVLISVPSERSIRIQEVHLLVLHCLCDGLDSQLLGNDELKEVL